MFRFLVSIMVFLIKLHQTVL